ncbi:hypothetical protein HMPREF2996_02350 [Corynebacterium sp. HMSC066C02]|uniref:hypothetical protein n=1 Tax=Corynebacterium sp. HMSC066C02 TaxID=1739500 RepID=UPI0008A5FCEC|nr:hypothetical protein [Corynebacterium sp. HMSC066C02]OFP22142.1 hypothetical protein HMPREF2996_02350 [Corynebacterium sp. HMSC066C02]
MTVTNYVVPHRGFGEPRRLTVDAVNPEMFLQLFSSAENSHLPVTLCGHSSSGFRVRHGGEIVGVIPASQSAAYAELDSIIGAGLTPQATAEIALREDAAEESIPVFEVLLPEPGLCVPLNIPPAQRWGMLNGDRALHITDFSATTHSLPKHPAHLLVRLSNRRHFFRRAIEVHLDDELVATIPRDQASQLSDTITGFKHEGLIAIARAYFTPDAEAPTLTLYTEDGTPNTSFAVKTAGVIAAAAGAAAATAASTAKAHATIAPIGSSKAAGAAQTTGSAVTKGAQALSLNSVGAAATTGTQIAVAGTGLKLACAASVAVLVGGTASFVSSVRAMHPAHDHVTDSVLEGYTTSLPAPSPANDAEADSEPSAWAEEETEGTAAGIHRPEHHSLATTSRAIENTAFSASAEPTELTGQPEPTEPAEPTQHAELAAPEEVTPSPRSSHEVPATPEAETQPEEPEKNTPSTRTSEPSSTPTQKATPTSAAPNTTPTATPRTSEPAPSTTAAPITSEPSDSLTSEPTTESSPEPSETPTSEPTAESSPKPEHTSEPSSTPKISPEPSETPTSELTTEPTPEPSETPKPKPSTERTPEPSRTPDPTPEPTPDRDGWVIIIEFG